MTRPGAGKPAHAEERSRERRGYETSDVSVGKIISLGLPVLLVLGAAAYLVTWVLFEAQTVETAQPAFSPLRGLQAPPPRPRLQVQPERDLLETSAAGRAALESYGWVDRDNGIVRIPIDRAMELILERGLPPRPTPPAEERKPQ